MDKERFKSGKELIRALYAIRNAILGKWENGGGDNSSGGNTKSSPYTWHDTPAGLVFMLGKSFELFFVPIEFCTSITKINQYLQQNFGFTNVPSPTDYYEINSLVVYDKVVNVLNCARVYIGGGNMGNETFLNNIDVWFPCEESADLFVCMNLLEYFDGLSLSDIHGLSNGCTALYIIDTNRDINFEPISGEPTQPVA